MPEIIIDARELTLLGERFMAAAATTPALIEKAMPRFGEVTKHIGVEQIRAVTPVRSGDLQASTMGEVAVEGEGVTVTIHQPALSKPGPGGHGGGTIYAPIVISGRGPIRPVNGRALASGDGSFGPVGYSGPAAPNPYNDEAVGPIRDELGAALPVEGEAILRELRAAL